MKKTIHLFYRLNFEHFLTSNLLVRQSPRWLQWIAFHSSLFFRVIFLGFIPIILVAFLQKNSYSQTYFYLFQIGLFFFARMIFSRQAKMSDGNLKSITFLFGNLFQKKEKKRNRELVALYYALATFVIYAYISSCFLYMNLFLQANYNMLSILLTIIVCSGCVYFRTFHLAYQKKGDFPWQVQYLFVFICFFLGKKFLAKGNFIQVLLILEKQSILFVGIWLAFGLFFLFESSLSSCLREKSGEKRYFNGLFATYFRENIQTTAGLFFFVVLMLNSFVRSDIGKSCFIVSIFTFLWIPNFANLPMIRYAKMIGNNGRFIFYYTRRIFFYSLPFLSFLTVLVVKNVWFVLLVMALFSLQMLIKACSFYYILQTGETDTKKADYMIFIGLFFLLLLFCLGIVWRG